MFSEIKWRFNLAIISSILLILLSAFQWSLVDIVTVFLMIPLFGAVWVFFLCCVISSLTCLLKLKDIGLKSAAPIGIHVIAFLLVTYVPFTMLWLKADFILNKELRELVVAQVLNGELKPNVSHNSSLINLGEEHIGLSRGGNDIVVENHEGLTYILFFTFRGLLDNYSGYLYVPSGGLPEKFRDLNEDDTTEIKHIEDNWYLISHH
ncbi:hypothetical protein [Pseudoalteromonas luteoviolacea]|uniref:Uncharacterized protein n=1 Tax=Pseudoalteromonas luteoviolacea H33 TaxID=1365251 RepID=A0A167D1D5_9GAMM|nr:hypothetical protein [Pseudoalteromonas luteoviolacea]KZN48308.1 hypothetical protein N476_22065 [Pseudoalteromonas luteoviolacea H33]KZN70047.1 hypothetical protein N477_25980 [Pseudoalteromonas luteoviolacea H33-S]